MTSINKKNACNNKNGENLYKNMYNNAIQMRLLSAVNFWNRNLSEMNWQFYTSKNSVNYLDRVAFQENLALNSLGCYHKAFFSKYDKETDSQFMNVNLILFCYCFLLGTIMEGL